MITEMIQNQMSYHKSNYDGRSKSFAIQYGRL